MGELCTRCGREELAFVLAKGGKSVVKHGKLYNGRFICSYCVLRTMRNPNKYALWPEDDPAPVIRRPVIGVGGGAMVDSKGLLCCLERGWCFRNEHRGGLTLSDTSLLAGY